MVGDDNAKIFVIHNGSEINTGEHQIHNDISTQLSPIHKAFDQTEYKPYGWNAGSQYDPEVTSVIPEDNTPNEQHLQNHQHGEENKWLEKRFVPLIAIRQNGSSLVSN